MDKLKHAFLIPLLCLLASCGAYFVDTGNLKDGHLEKTALLGTWSNGDLLISFEDGPDHTDKFCFVQDDSLIKGDAYIVPITGGHMIILSDFTDPKIPENRPLKGEYIMLLAERESGVINLIRPFDHIEEGDPLPFATHCPEVQPEGTLSEAGFIPYCLKPETTPEEIATWASNQNDITIETTLHLAPTANIPAFCLE